MINHKYHNPKQIVTSTLTFELERRLKLKFNEFGRLLRHLYGYDSVSFLKPATDDELRINSCFKNTRHLTQTKERSLDEKRFHSKNVREDLLHTLNTSLVRSPFLGLFKFPFIQIKSNINK